jgi:hypothetical protein
LEKVEVALSSDKRETLYAEAGSQGWWMENWIEASEARDGARFGEGLGPNV